jgi:iron-sulfur cluster repair protein YtfE (RIC family)
MHDVTTTELLDEDGNLVPVWMFLTFHQALRRDAARFRSTSADLADAGGPAEPLQAMAEHWEQYHRLLDFHHTMEDKGLFPLMRSIRPDLGGLVDELDGEHHTLEDLLVELEGVVRRACSTRSTDDLEQLADGFQRLESLLIPHLAAEEEQLVPAMLDHLAATAAGAAEDDQPEEDAPAGPPPGPVPESFAEPWSMEHLSGEVLDAALAALPTETASQYPTWLADYRASLARWAPGVTV